MYSFSAIIFAHKLWRMFNMLALRSLKDAVMRIDGTFCIWNDFRRRRSARFCSSRSVDSWIYSKPTISDWNTSRARRERSTGWTWRNLSTARSDFPSSIPCWSFAWNSTRQTRRNWKKSTPGTCSACKWSAIWPPAVFSATTTRQRLWQATSCKVHKRLNLRR